MPRFIQVLLIGVAIPAVGFAVSSWILSDVNNGLAAEGLPSSDQLCRLDLVLSDSEMRAACDQLGRVQFLKAASIYIGLFGLSIPVLFWLASTFVGNSRSRLAATFPPLVTLSILLLSLMVMAQGAILTYAAYVAESYLLGTIHFIVIGVIGLGALAGAFGLIKASTSVGRRLETRVIGQHLPRRTAPKLYSFVEKLAKTLAARPPEHIVVGLEPNFFVTSADIILPGSRQSLKGETLFISTSLARLLSTKEFAAVLGHELGHFRGEDTRYTMRFAPVYAGLGHAISALESDEEEGLAALTKLPAISILSYMAEVFATNERSVGRTRELVADQAGAEASSRQALASALVKLSVYSGLWKLARTSNLDRLRQGKITRNLSSVFQDLAKYDVEHDSLEELKSQILNQRIPHPTDTHPQTSERLTALDVSPSEITKEMLLVAENPAIHLLEGYTAIEEELTLTEHKLMVALGLVSLPDEDEDEQNYLLRTAYSLAAAVVGADGRIEPPEIAIAEGVGSRLFEDFDPVEFRETCNNLNEIPNIEQLSEFLAEILEPDQKSLVLQYLKAIAQADGEISSEEQAVLNRIAAALRIPLDADHPAP